MKPIVTPRDLDPWLIQLAFTKPSESPVASLYLRAGDVPPRSTQDELPVVHALGMVRRFLETHTARGEAGLAIFARAGDHPFFRAASLPAPVHTALSVGDLPHLYQLACARRNATPFLIAASRSRRLIGVEFGAIVLDFRTPEGEAAHAALLEHYAQRFAHVVDSAAEGESAAAMVSRALPLVRKRDRMQRLAPVLRVLLREPDRVVRGPLDTLRAVSEGRAASLVLIDGHTSSNERSEWETGVREVLVATAIRQRIPWDVIDDASSVPELDAFTCLLKKSSEGDGSHVHERVLAVV